MKQTKSSEELFRLLALSGQGDRVAFQALYEATSAKLFGLSLRILNRRDLAEEALQDAFINIWHHAQNYRPEKAAVMTSMNLLKSSALESIELAVSVSRALHPDGYQQAFRVVESLMKTAEQDRLRSTVRPLTSVAEPARESTSRMREPSRRSTGHCIRCKDDLPFNPEKPLCPSCYKIWSKYEDADYAEEYCHHCGKKHATSLRKPVCRACYGAMA